MSRPQCESGGAAGKDSSTPDSDHRPAGSHRLVLWTPIAVALVLIFSMMSEREEWLYVAAVLGALASLAVGRTLGRSDQLSLRTLVRRFAKGWGVVVLLAALSLLHGKWQPMAFFAVVGVISSVLFWAGCKTSK